MTTFRRFLYTFAGCAYLASCATTPPPPKIIEVPTVRYVPIPAELDADCPIPALTNRTVGAAIDWAIQARGALIQCNDRMAGIRAIAGSPVPGK